MSKIRIVAAVHATRADDANQLTMVLAEGPEDVRTYVEPYWMGPGGEDYAVSSWQAGSEFVSVATGPLVRPAWDTDNIIDMDAARRAQAALVFWTPLEGGTAPAASPSALVAIGGLSVQAALAALGVSQQVPDTPYDKTTQSRVWQQSMSWMPDDAVRIDVLVELAEGTITATHEFTGPRPDKPFASWTWDAGAALWVAPVAYPTDGADYVWSEADGEWQAV